MWCVNAASVSRTKAGMADTGKEMSCLMLWPSRLCAKGMDSRTCHSAADWARLSATAASLIVPASSAAPNKVSKRVRAAASLSVALCSSNTVHNAPGKGRGRAGKCLATKVSACCPIISKPVSAGPRCKRAKPSNATQSSTLAQAAIAVVVAAGKGLSLRVAAVMTPSVPSLPMNKSRRS